MLRALVAAMLLAALMAGCTTTDDPDPTSPTATNAPAGCAPQGPNPYVVFSTSMGDITLEVFREQVPLTANNFLSHVTAGDYAGTKFHRIITGFMMQGGDPNSKDADPSNDGQGGAGSTILDEFHWHLRHKGEGMVSMANSGPNTGKSQFFITFADTAHLDDKHAIFAKVVCGIEVVRKVNSDASSQSGTPKTAVVLKSASVIEPALMPAPKWSLDFWVPAGQSKVGSAGGATAFLATIHNGGNQRLAVNLTVEAPQGVTATIEPAFASPTVPADQNVAFVVKVQVGEGASTTSVLKLMAKGGGVEAQANLTVKRDSAVGPRTVASGDSVTANYIGMTVDGRIFDTSISAVGKDAAARGLGYAGFNPNKPYGTFPFTPGSNVIQGFTELAVGMQEGGTNAGRMPPEKAYGSSQHALAGRTLLFQLEIVDIK